MSILENSISNHLCFKNVEIAHLAETIVIHAEKKNALTMIFATDAYVKIQ